MTGPDIMPATLRGKVLGAAVVILSLLLIVFFQLLVFPAIPKMIEPYSSIQAINTFKYLLGGFTAIALFPAVVLIGIGRKIQKHQQSPSPNAWIWRDTKIKRGRDALRIGWTCIIAGILSCLLCLALVSYI